MFKFSLKHDSTESAIFKGNIVSGSHSLGQILIVNLDAIVCTRTAVELVRLNIGGLAHFKVDTFLRLRSLTAANLSSTHVEHQSTRLVWSELPRLKESTNHSSVVLWISM